MPKALPFQRVWVTGASTGIGRATALELARRGAHVAATARSADKLGSLVQEAAGLAGSITAFPGDVTDKAAMAETGAAIIETLGGLDVALLNAGSHFPVGLDHWSDEAFENALQLNVMGVIHCISAVLPVFQAQGHGHIAIVSSLAGIRGLPTSAAYGASKAAVSYLAESLRCEQADSGIKAQIIHPGFVRTPLTDQNDFPMPFLMPVDKAARQIVDGMCSNRFEITFPRRLAWLVKTAAMLPNVLYFPVIRAVTKSRR